ncbi:MAG: hypothetical protein R2939_19975 [Kofleriaceae bacterium]
MSNKPDDVPPAKVALGGKLGGDVPRAGAPTTSGGGSQKRRVSNFLLNKQLQLRYMVFVTAVSALISGALGYLIYRQEHAATTALAKDLGTFGDADLQRAVASSMRAGDDQLVFTMVGVGIGLVVVLSLYLLVMTHKVAGPLYKVSVHFDDMAEGRLASVAGPRKGDMLQDFYGDFREMHEATRARVAADVAVMQGLLEACDAAGIARTGDGAALGALGDHVGARRAALR